MIRFGNNCKICFDFRGIQVHPKKENSSAPLNNLCGIFFWRLLCLKTLPLLALPKPISLYPILGVNFVGTLGFSIVFPFLVFLVLDLGGNALIYGIMGATYSAFQLVGAPILGRWSDLYSRKKILLLSQIGTLLSWGIFLLALSLPLQNFMDVDSKLLGKFSLTLPLMILFVARALDGITGGNVSVATAYLADITDDKHRSENFGKMAISGNLGLVVGPAIAGLIGATPLGESLPVMVAMGISLVATLMIMFQLPESQPSVLQSSLEQDHLRKIFGQEHKECYQIEIPDNLSIKDILKMKHISYLMTLYFLVFLGFNLFYIAFPVHVAQELHWGTRTGIYFTFLSFVMVVVQGPVLKWASQKWSDGLLILAGSLILGLSFLCILSSSLWFIYGGAILLALGNGVMWPSVLSVISKVTEEKYQGLIQGFASSCGSLASIIGLLLGGIFYNIFHERVFILSAIFLFIVFLMSFKFLKLKL